MKRWAEVHLAVSLVCVFVARVLIPVELISTLMTAVFPPLKGKGGGVVYELPKGCKHFYMLRSDDVVFMYLFIYLFIYF